MYYFIANTETICCCWLYSKTFSAEEHETYQAQQRFIKQLGLAGLMTMQVMMLSFGFYFDWLVILTITVKYFHWISLVLTTPVVVYSGSTFI